MAAKKAFPFSVEGVLARLTHYMGLRYTCHALAKTCQVRATAMQAVLDELVSQRAIKITADGNGRWYWVPTPQECEMAEARTLIRPFRPLTGYDALMRRIAEDAERGR